MMRIVMLGLCMALVAQVNANQLPAKVDSVVKAFKVPLNSFSVLVQEVAGAKPLVSVNAAAPRNPASTIKVLTTWLALEQLGPAWTWPTEAYLRGELESGTLSGDLILKGYGDPYLIQERLWAFQRDLKNRGLRQIDGNLIIDNSYFLDEYVDPAKFDGRGLRVYNVNPSALLVNFQAIRFQFVPDPTAGRVDVIADPLPSNVQIDNRLKLRQGRCGGYQNGVAVSTDGSESRDKIIFSGNYGANCDDFSLMRSALSAPAYAYGVFRSLWEESGGKLSGDWRLGVVADDAELFATVESPPLSDVIEYVNKFSNNVMARHLFLTLGAEQFGAPASREKGRSAAQAILQSKGLYFPELTLDNGAGLSRDTRISAASLAQVLLAATASPWEAEFVSSLSLTGLDGTMRKKFRNGELTGRMHLKSGRLRDVFAVAGYVHARSGKDFVVVVLQNYPDADRGPGEAIQNALFRWVYEQ